MDGLSWSLATKLIALDRLADARRVDEFPFTEIKA
jgi:hypothetical protein